MKKRVAIAGSIIADTVKIIDEWPQKGMLVNISKESKSVGGCVCNTGIDLKALAPEIDVSAYGGIGDDELGVWIKSVLEEKGLDVSHIQILENQSTSYTDVMTVESTGERTFFHTRGANRAFCADHVGVESLQADLFHMGYLLLLDRLDERDEEFGTKAARLLSEVQSKGIKTSIDLVSDQSGKFQQTVLPSLKYCNYVVINEVEGGLLTGISPRDGQGEILLDNCKKICEKILSFGVKDVVVIHCPEMSCAMEAGGRFTAMGSLALPKGYIVGSVGAGDAFCAGMLYGFVYGLSMEESMTIASCAAACNLAVKDSVSGAKSLEETIALNKKYLRRTI